jgi:hypothetical protein
MPADLQKMREMGEAPEKGAPLTGRATDATNNMSNDMMNFIE